MKSNHVYIKISGLYAFTYLGLGALVPLLSTYFKEIGLTGIQIGTIGAISSLMCIISPPLLGYFSDKLQIHKPVMFICFFSAALLSVFLPQFRNYRLLLIILSLFYFFQAGTLSLLDATALHAPIPFGKIRQWGSYGFALSVFAIGYLADRTENKIIFYGYAIFIFVATFIILGIKLNLNHEKHENSKLISTLLKRKDFQLFLLIGFFVSGTLGSQNVYFGLHYMALGGTISGFSLCFLLFTASEAPFMQFAAGWINQLGIYKVLFISIFLGICRWILYSASPAPVVFLITFVLQGLFYGPYLVATAEWIRKNIPPNVRSTAMTFYAAFGFGLGGMFCNFLGGYLMDYFGTATIYGYFAFVCLFGLLLIRPLQKQSKASTF